MEQLYKEMQERLIYLKAQEQTEEIKARISEIMLSIVKVQQLLLDGLNKNKIIPFLPNMIPMRDIKQISDGDRLFRELGYKKRMMDLSYVDNWIREGRFMEIENVKEYIENDKQLSDIEYLEHHNFMLIKKQ